jgi:hypothetical protein
MHEPDLILKALKLCRLELSRFPTLAEILKRMDVKSGSTKTHELVGTIFDAIAWCGYTNPTGARELIGEVGWKAVCNFGGWQRVCETPDSQISTMRAQLRGAVEAAVEEKSRCDVLGLEFKSRATENPFRLVSGMRSLDFSGFGTEGA